MNERLRIRAAGEADVPLILRFIRELADYEKLPHECVATEDSVRSTLFGSPRFAEVLIADVEQTLLSANVEQTLLSANVEQTLLSAPDADQGVSSTPAGFALFFHNYSTFLARPGIYLEDLYVRPEYRGRGFGKALLARLAQIATERSCGRLEWAVLTWNQPAIGFYKSLGARPLDEWIVFRLTGKELADLGVLSSPASPEARLNGRG